MRYKIKLFKWCVKDIFFFIFFNGPWYEVEDDIRRLRKIKNQRGINEELAITRNLQKIQK